MRISAERTGNSARHVHRYKFVMRCIGMDTRRHVGTGPPNPHPHAVALAAVSSNRLRLLSAPMRQHFG
jgi:hypothetical protein